MPDSTLTDNEAREAIRDLTNRTLFVAAGAGTGKTHALVQRILSLIYRDGIQLPSIAAITFTNAAAAELRDRVARELAHAADPGHPGYPDLTPEQRKRCQQAREDIDSAAIQTLHSFAQRILNLYPMQAGLPPEISVRDDVGATIAFEEHWQPFLESLLDNTTNNLQLAEAILKAFWLGLTADHLRELAHRFHEDWDRVLPATFDRPPVPLITAATILEPLEAALELSENHKGPDEAYAILQDLKVIAAGLRAAQQILESHPAEDERLAAQEEIVLNLSRRSLKVGKGRQGDWNGDSLKRIKAYAAEAEAARTTLIEDLRAATLGPILTALQGFAQSYLDERIRQGTLEFHDMIFLARQLLKDNPAVRNELHNRFTHLLIDEFQDTDPAQVEIAVLIASADPDAGQKDWSEASVDPGRLFFVGDPKQSIYRFRRADIDLYTQTGQRFGSEGEGKSVSLISNFRTVPSVIHWVNHVFSEVFANRLAEPSPGQPQQVEYEPLVPARDAATPASAVHLFGGPAEGNVDDIRTVEAEEIAAIIHGIKAAPDNRWQLFPKGEEPRKPNFSDIAILLPARTSLPFLARALNEAAIPCRIEARSLLFETQEVRDLMNILAAIDDPTDEVAVVAALRSPAFGCSDADLAAFKQARGLWNYTRELPAAYPPGGPVALAMASLNTFNQDRWYATAPELIDRVIRERKLFELAFAGRRPRDSWQRLRFVQEQARAFTSAGGRSLRQFVQFMDRQAEEKARMTETAVAEDDDDAVRIMTIHASKGLEFPIVILTGLNKASGGNTSSSVLWDARHRPQVSIGASETGRFQTPGYEALKDRETLMDRLEGERLIYVAATRARDHLLVSTHHKATAKGHESQHIERKCSPAECIHAISQQDTSLWNRIEALAATPAPATQPSAAPVVPISRQQWQQERERLLAASSRRPARSATSIAHPTDEKPEQQDEEAPAKRGRGGTATGRAVHAVLQSIDLATGHGMDEAIAAQVTAESPDVSPETIRRLVQSALNSPAVREAVASTKYWREVYVSASVEGVMLEGFIDLLYEAPDGLVVVDYKTDYLQDEAAIDAALARYRLQAAAYALALQTTLNRTVSRAVFVFAARQQECVIEDLPRAMQEVRTVLRTPPSS